MYGSSAERIPFNSSGARLPMSLSIRCACTHLERKRGPISAVVAIMLEKKLLMITDGDRPIT